MKFFVVRIVNNILGKSTAKIDEYETGDVPSIRDAQIIVQPDEQLTYRTQSGYDFYVWREEQGRWVGVDKFGLYDYLLDTGLVIFGRTVTQSDFNIAMKAALDVIGSKKAGWGRDEKKLE